ncbi:MAG: tetratricopeptide repeat protein, partial [Pseudomonadales bacterium]
YQLARAHDIQGEGEAAVAYLDRLIADFPESEYTVEAHFRRAESAFSRGDYGQAAADFGVVVAAGDDNRLWQNANYMRGWSLFKESDLEAGLVNFFAVIDGLVGAHSASAGDPEQGLAATDQELLDDSLRVVTLALGYLEGSQTLAQEMRAISKPSWQYLVYQRLADDHLEKERYLDSVATWQTFVDENPLDLRAPNAHQGMVDTLVAADFPSEILPKKQDYVASYGVRSEFWQVHAGADRSAYLPTLKTYLQELASIAHANAQTLAAKAKGRKRDQQAVKAAFLAAADWYEQTVETFPEDSSVADQLFLLGEVYTEAAEPAAAVTAYQRLLREFPEHPNAAEAGYAAILGYGTLLAAQSASGVVDDAERARMTQRKIDAQVEFALLFGDDPRAPTVQTDAADSLFKMGQFEPAMALATAAIETWPDQGPTLAATNLLILGHGGFELGQYAQAEGAYQRYLNTGPVPEQQALVKEKLLAAVYRQGEAAEANQDIEQAIAHFQRMQAVDFNAQLTVQGQYDAIAVVEAAQQLDRTAALLQQFRADYPGHPLAKGIDMRMASLYERSENFAAAAGEYVNVSRSSSDPEVARQSLYRAAELYLEQGDSSAAETYFADYVQRYPKPRDLNLEAVQQLDEFALARGDDAGRTQWLQRKIEIQKRMGRDASERATYLAADAQLVFAGRERTRFDAVRLTRPLAKSLKQKTRSLKQTVAAYEAVADYKVGALASVSTYQIADMYVALAKSIMESERPTGLSALELEQYDLLLEEQAYPFEEQAISLHEINMQRSWEGIYDEYVQQSFVALRSLMPGRFDKQERQIAYVERIH